MNIDDLVIVSLIKKLFNTATFKAVGAVFLKKLYIMCLKTVILIVFCFLVIVKATCTEVASSSAHVLKETLEVKYERLLAKLKKNQETQTDAIKSVDRKKRSVPSKYHFLINFIFLIKYPEINRNLTAWFFIMISVCSKITLDVENFLIFIWNKQ